MFLGWEPLVDHNSPFGVRNSLEMRREAVVVGALLIVWLSAPWLYAQQARPLEIPLYEWDPYIHPEGFDEFEIWTGLDLEVAKLALAGAEISYSLGEPSTWTQIMADVAAGRADIAIGGFKTDEREEFAFFSDPLRIEETALYIRRGELDGFQFQTVDELFELFHREGLRLGIVAGWSYSPAVDSHLDGMRERGLVTAVEAESDLVPLLINGKVDAYFSGLVAGQTFLFLIQ